MNLFVLFQILWIGCVMQFGTSPATEVQNGIHSMNCFEENLRKPRIVGGTNAERNEMPFIVSLTKRGGHFCGATILNRLWLVTAGHCVCNGFNEIVKPSQIKAVLGLHKISEFNRNEINSNTYEVILKNIIVHPEYNCNKPINDIALLELSDPIKFTEHIRPTCLYDETTNDDFDGHLGTVAGWGWTNEDQEIGDRADVLQKAHVEIWKNDECQRSFRENVKPHKITETQMCAGKLTGGIDSCWADSGGPLISKKNYLIGVVSTGVGCARPGLPGIYTRVSKYLNWINDIIKS